MQTDLPASGLKKTETPAEITNHVPVKSLAPRLSVVAPCRNEAEGLAEFHRRLAEACRPFGESYEIVLVNDGSTDETWARMRDLAQADPHVTAIDLSRNHGHQLALTAGLSLCTGRRVLIIDADLQDPPELLPEMMAMMDSGAHVVYGRRRKRQAETAFKRATAAFFYRLVDMLTDTPIPRDTGDFRLISRQALDVLLQMPERHRYIRGMVSWIGLRQEPILYDRQPRFAGKTKYPLFHMIKFALDAITAFSIKPLRLASIAGIFTGIVAFALVLYSLYSWLFLHAVTGWTSLMATVALLSAVQLMTMGIFGEYLGRLYDQSKGRPLFIVAEILRSSPSPSASASGSSSETATPQPANNTPAPTGHRAEIPAQEIGRE